MEWDEALLKVRSGETTLQPASYYRRKAARARQIAEGFTTPGVKAWLLDEATHCNHLAAAANRLTDED
jgi:hypothetical protein